MLPWLVGVESSTMLFYAVVCHSLLLLGFHHLTCAVWCSRWGRGGCIQGKPWRYCMWLGLIYVLVAVSWTWHHAGVHYVVAWVNASYIWQVLSVSSFTGMDFWHGSHGDTGEFVFSWCLNMYVLNVFTTQFSAQRRYVVLLLQQCFYDCISWVIAQCALQSGPIRFTSKVGPRLLTPSCLIKRLQVHWAPWHSRFWTGWPHAL